MGVDLHITRADTWCNSEDVPITKDEWLAYIVADEEFELADESGFVVWRGPSKYSDPWLEWSGGQVQTKYPDTALYNKMLQIASKFNAHVEDDDGKLYQLATEWDFDPSERVRKHDMNTDNLKPGLSLIRRLRILLKW